MLPSTNTAAACTARSEPGLVPVFLVLTVTCGVGRLPLFHPMASGDNWGRYSAINNQQVSVFTATEILCRTA